MPTFTDTIYTIVAQIPRGKVASYGLIAILARRPRAARAVGMAMRDAPEHLPCHRVIRADGSLACKRIFAGRQHAMLQKEGVHFHPNGKVDMPHSEWSAEKALTPPTAMRETSTNVPPK
jgi:methylated-DNA-protein-cysteine methyltransferase-like protein